MKGGVLTPTPSLPKKCLWIRYYHWQSLLIKTDIQIVFYISDSNLKMQGKLVYIHVERNNMQYHAGITLSFHFSLSLKSIQPPNYNKIKDTC